MSDYRDATTLAELDRLCGKPKGHAFRCFKQLSAHWLEGRDYTLLTPATDAAAIAALKAQGRVYRSSVNVLLLSAQAARQVQSTLAPQDPGSAPQQR